MLLKSPPHTHTHNKQLGTVGGDGTGTLSEVHIRIPAVDSLSNLLLLIP